MSSKRIDLASNVVAPCAIIPATFVLFDQCMWFLALRFETFTSYKLRPSVESRRYPRYYFRNFEQRGFDITPNSVGAEHLIGEEGYSYSVWANRLGCFDNHSDVPIQPYIHVAGDSLA
jgi:hypothetical protein